MTFFTVCPGESNDGAEDDWSHVVFCVENWQFETGFMEIFYFHSRFCMKLDFFNTDLSHDPRLRVYYSIFSASVQYILPFVFIGIIYGLIYLYLRRYRFVRHGSQTGNKKTTLKVKHLIIMPLKFQIWRR